MTDAWVCTVCKRKSASSLEPTLSDRFRAGHCFGCGSRMLFRLSTEADEPVAHARNTDPETSHQAAASVQRIRQTQRVVLDTLSHAGPMTDEEVWDYLYQSGTYTPSGLRTRRSELVAMGKVRDSGQRKTLRTGRRAIVWEVAA